MNIENNIDLEKLIGYANTYSNATGIGICILNSNGDSLYRTSNFIEAYKFCEHLKNEADISVNCKNGHFHAMQQARKFGGSYVFFCPVGITHFIAPISVNDEIHTSFLGGPIIMSSKSEFLSDEIRLKYDLDQNALNELEKLLAFIPSIEPKKVTNLSNLLNIIASYAGDAIKHNLQQELYIQQSEISNNIYELADYENSGKHVDQYPIQTENELLEAIRTCDKPASQRLLNEILGFVFFSSGGNLNVIKARTLELVVLLSRAAMAGGADVNKIFGLNHRYLSEIHYFSNIDDLAFWLSKIMNRFTDQVFRLSGIKHVDVIYKSVDYINKNYSKKITLEEVSSFVYLSPSYFSKIFKEEMRCNFNTYLNTIRIDNAKKLLLKDRINLVDVSNLVGFEDQSYFSKVFKKITGVTPGKYKESRGKILNTVKPKRKK